MNILMRNLNFHKNDKKNIFFSKVKSIFFRHRVNQSVCICQTFLPHLILASINGQELKGWVQKLFQNHCQILVRVYTNVALNSIDFAWHGMAKWSEYLSNFQVSLAKLSRILLVFCQNKKTCGITRTFTGFNKI